MHNGLEHIANYTTESEVAFCKKSAMSAGSHFGGTGGERGTLIQIMNRNHRTQVNRDTAGKEESSKTWYGKHFNNPDLDFVLGNWTNDDLWNFNIDNMNILPLN